MKAICEVSRPHYHPGPDFGMKVTKKRDLSVAPHWVANERITNPHNGESYAIVMPPRDRELFEDRQFAHIHIPEYMNIMHNGKKIWVKVKVEPYAFEPRVHFDHVEAEQLGIKGGEEVEL